MVDKVANTVFLAASAIVGIFIVAAPFRVARVFGASEKWRKSMKLTLWRILGAAVSMGCIVNLFCIWVLGWKG